MAAAPTLSKAQQPHLSGSPSPSPSPRRLDDASSSSSNDSKILYSVHLVLPPGREEELSKNAKEKEKWYHSFISGGKRTGVGQDKDPRIYQAWENHRLVGFTALLTREEALALKDYKGFFYARPSTAYPSPYPTRPMIENKKSSLFREIDIEEYICASDEIMEQFRMEKLNTSSRLVQFSTK